MITDLKAGCKNVHVDDVTSCSASVEVGVVVTYLSAWITGKVCGPKVMRYGKYKEFKR